jgi:putative sterol carrier protein
VFFISFISYRFKKSKHLYIKGGIKMLGKLLYLSPEWRDEVEKRLKAELSPEKMSYATSSMSYIHLNCPDGGARYIYFRFENGDLGELEVGRIPSRESEFKITGQYDTFAKISNSELDSQSALMSGKLKLNGNILKAIKLAPACDRINKVLSSIPAEY